MLNDINVKNSWDCVRCKYQLKLITKTREKNVATNENYILRKKSLKFQNPSFNILCKIAFWNKQKCLNKELIIWSGLPREKGSLFLFARKFLIGGNWASLHSQSPASSISLLAHFQVMSSEVGQPVLGLHIFRNLAEEKVNMAPKNTSKSGPIFCVNSMLTQNDSVLLQFFIPWEFNNQTIRRKH